MSDNLKPQPRSTTILDNIILTYHYKRWLKTRFTFGFLNDTLTDIVIHNNITGSNETEALRCLIQCVSCYHPQNHRLAIHRR